MNRGSAPAACCKRQRLRYFNEAPIHESGKYYLTSATSP